MSKSLLFQIVKQILVNLVVHLFYERRFLVNGTSFPPPPPPHRDTQLPFDMLFITMFYTCHVTEAVYHRGGTASYKKKCKTLYSLKPHSYGHICIPKYFFTHVYIYLGVQFLSYERNCSYANPAHVSKFAHGQD